MATDKELLLQFLNQAHVEYDIELKGYRKPDKPENAIYVKEGYIGFYTVFKFDEHDKLTHMGVYE